MMKNENHYGPHCAGLCEGASYISTIRNLEAEIERLTPYYHAIDEVCVVSHIGTAESFGSAKEALDAVVAWTAGVNKYFEETNNG